MDFVGSRGSTARTGNRGAMTETPDERMVEGRQDLLPEEDAVGSDDPEAQARAVLEESADRVRHPSRTRAESTQTPGEDGPR